MEFIILDPKEYKYNVNHSWNYSKEVVHINPFLIESIVNKEMWGGEEPFMTYICTSSDTQYCVCFRSSFERDRFTKELINTIKTLYKGK